MSPETIEGKIQIAMLSQQIKDHTESNDRDFTNIRGAFSEVKDGLTRIETKIDKVTEVASNKADRDAVESINSIIAAKANSEEVKGKADKTDVDTLNNRLWGLIITVGIALLGFVIWTLERLLDGHLKW